MSAPPPPPPPLPAAGPEGAAPAAPANSTHSTVYVGHLSPRTERRDVEELFEKYGRVISVELKHGGFAFVEYEDPRDADDAVSKLNGYELDGNRISVEWSRRSGGPGSGCFLCNGTGHWARECPEASEKGMDVKSGKCFKSPDRGYGGPGGYRQRSPYHPGGGHGGHGGYRGRSPSPYYRDGGRGRSPSPYGRGAPPPPPPPPQRRV
ncbi:hypothetical protein BGZ90_001040 [Linnemannia elongata]|nr:hypothetical protein BGZ90_001040 [Linnemannia elongata]